MPRVSIDDSLYLDPRFHQLSAKLKDLNTAFGALIRSWTVAQRFYLKDDRRVPLEEWKKQALPMEIIEVGLAEIEDGRVRVKGADTYFGWLLKCKESGTQKGKGYPRVPEGTPLKKEGTLGYLKVPEGTLGYPKVPEGTPPENEGTPQKREGKLTSYSSSYLIKEEEEAAAGKKTEVLKYAPPGYRGFANRFNPDAEAHRKKYLDTFTANFDEATEPGFGKKLFDVSKRYCEELDLRFPDHRDFGEWLNREVLSTPKFSTLEDHYELRKYIASAIRNVCREREPV